MINGAGRPTSGELRLLYDDEGMTQQAIADKYGVHSTTVWYWMTRYRIPSRRASAQERADADVIASLYRAGWTQHEIATYLGISQTTVWRRMKQRGIAARPAHVPRKLRADEVRALRRRGYTMQRIADQLDAGLTTVHRCLHATDAHRLAQEILKHRTRRQIQANGWLSDLLQENA